MDKLWVHFGCFKARYDYLIVFTVAPITWTFELFGSFKMDQVVYCVHKGLKHLIDKLEGFLMTKKWDCLGNKQDSFSKVVFCVSPIYEDFGVHGDFNE